MNPYYNHGNPCFPGKEFAAGIHFGRALKAQEHESPGQRPGNNVPQIYPSPEGALQNPSHTSPSSIATVCRLPNSRNFASRSWQGECHRVPPFQGSLIGCVHYPGRCPGLSCHAPLARPRVRSRRIHPPLGFRGRELTFGERNEHKAKSCASAVQ